MDQYTSATLQMQSPCGARLFHGLARELTLNAHRERTDALPPDAQLPLVAVAPREQSRELRAAVARLSRARQCRGVPCATGNLRGSEASKRSHSARQQLVLAVAVTQRPKSAFAPRVQGAVGSD